MFAVPFQKFKTLFAAPKPVVEHPLKDIIDIAGPSGSLVACWLNYVACPTNRTVRECFAQALAVLIEKLKIQADSLSRSGKRPGADELIPYLADAIKQEFSDIKEEGIVEFPIMDDRKMEALLENILESDNLQSEFANMLVNEHHAFGEHFDRTLLPAFFANTKVAFITAIIELTDAYQVSSAASSDQEWISVLASSPSSNLHPS